MQESTHGTDGGGKGKDQGGQDKTREPGELLLCFACCLGGCWLLAHLYREWVRPYGHGPGEESPSIRSYVVFKSTGKV
jgi:hypothetical protein